MRTYTIYNRPKDYPNNYVVRAFKIVPGSPPIPTDEVAIADSLEELRKLIPSECIRFPRNVTDDSAIVETWI